MVSFILFILLLTSLVWCARLVAKNRALSKWTIDLNQENAKDREKFSKIIDNQFQNFLTQLKFIHDNQEPRKLLASFADDRLDLRYIIEPKNKFNPFELKIDQSNVDLDEDTLRCREKLFYVYTENNFHKDYENIAKFITQELINDGFIMVRTVNPYQVSVRIAYYKKS